MWTPTHERKNIFVAWKNIWNVCVSLERDSTAWYKILHLTAVSKMLPILQQYQKCCLLCDIVGINFCEKVQQVKNCAARFTFICMQNSALILVQILNSLSHRAIYTVLCRKRKVRGEKKTQGPFIECHSKLDFRLLKNVAEPVPRYRVARSDVETNIWRWSKRDWLSLLLAQE